MFHRSRVDLRTNSYRRPSRGIAAGLLIAPLVAGGASAQVLPLGDDFQVNTGTSGYQSSPQVAALPDGGFVVAWCCGPGGTDGSIAGQRFDPGGAAIGPELVLSEIEPRRTTGIAADADGNFVVIWGNGSSGPGGGNPSDVHGRSFAADGAPLGGEFVVNSEGGTEYTRGGEVASRSDGSFLVVFESYGGWGQHYDAAGAPVGGNFAVAPAPEFGHDPAVAARASGGMIVAWEERTSPGTRLRGQRFASDGSRTGSPFTVAGPSAFSWGGTVATQPDGRFVVAWTAPGVVGGFDVRARRFAANGQPLAPSFLVSQQTTGQRFDPALAVDEVGRFVVAWTGTGSGGAYEYEIFARRFGTDGAALGGEFQVNTYTTDSQSEPSIRALAGDRMVVAWSSRGSAGSDSADLSVQARRLLFPFFFDGFESGDASAWSSTSP